MRWILGFVIVCFSEVLIAEESLCVVTFNIRYDAGGDRGDNDWKIREPVVVKAVQEMDPDVLGIQEGLIHQVRELDRDLPAYARVGVGRSDGKEAGEFSAIYFRKARLKLDESEQGTFWLSSTPEKVGSKDWGNGIERICTWARFLDLKSGRGFYVFNTHWDHRHQGSREQAARLISARIDARKKKGEGVVLMGDFNAVETNAAVAFLTGKKVVLADREEAQEWKAPLRLAYFEKHPDEPNRRTAHGWSGKMEGHTMIDHILLSPAWKVSTAEISHYRDGLVWPSDHFPVFATISWMEE